VQSADLSERSISVYVGRFAPSPTGPLHVGSLLTAVASFLDARSNHGLWRLRIDDLDTARTVSESISGILDILEKSGLAWDGPIVYQSRQLEMYQTALARLERKDLVYACNCSRKYLNGVAADGSDHRIYPGICRGKKLGAAARHAMRIRTCDSAIGFMDRLQGYYQQNLARDVGDFILKRRDKVFAYQLAVVIDDATQKVNQVVRGIDLIASTPQQIYLHSLLDLPVPDYCHVPIVVDQHGIKLSKQTGAQAVRASELSSVLYKVLGLLKHPAPTEVKGAPPQELLQWGIENWDIRKLEKARRVS
jgi:glutamyl-Q tRNA(Asp) synthetase